MRTSFDFSFEMAKIGVGVILAALWIGSFAISTTLGFIVGGVALVAMLVALVAIFIEMEREH